MGERGAAILSSPPPPPPAHSHMHWLTAQISHTLQSQLLCSTATATMGRCDSVISVTKKKKKKRTSIPNDATAAEQKNPA